MNNYLSIFIESLLSKNILLVYFLGMCSFVACSANISTALGLGLTVLLVLVITSPLNWIIFQYVLQKDALEWINITNTDMNFLRLLVFIAVIASVVQLLEAVTEKYFKPLYHALGVFLPLIAVNCAILGTSLFVIEQEMTFSESIVFSLGSGLGWLLAIIMMAGIRKKMRYADVPYYLQGTAVILIITGIIGMAFVGFSGIGTF